jgi:hypothetical protein
MPTNALQWLSAQLRRLGSCGTRSAVPGDLARCAETCLREMLGDYRPNAGAVQRFIERYGPEAAADVPSEPVTAKWRQQNVLVPAVLGLNGHIVDLTDSPTRRVIEIAHADLLVEHQLAHVDLHEITTSRRVVTQIIAGYLYDRGAAAVKFASKVTWAGLLRAVREPRNGQLSRRNLVAHRPGTRGIVNGRPRLGASHGAGPTEGHRPVPGGVITNAGQGHVRVTSKPD